MNRRTVVTAVLLLAPISAFSEQDLLDAYSAAKINDPQFQAATYAYGVAQETIPQAKAALMPGIVLDARVGKTAQDIKEQSSSIFGTPEDTPRYRTTAYTLEANQPIYRYSSWVALSQAKAVVRQAHSQFLAQEQELIRRCAEAYILVLAAQDNLDFTQAELAAVGRQSEVVKARRRGGLANITDEHEASARYSRVEANAIQAKFLLDDAYEGLREIVGNSLVEILPFKTDIPLVEPSPADMQHWITEAQEKNLSLIAANEGVLAANEEIKKQRGGHYPNLDLVLRHGNFDSDQAPSGLGGGGNNIDTTEVALQLTVPIYSGGAVSSLTRQAHMQYQQALEERTQQYRRVTRETRAAFQSVGSAISRVNALRESVTAQESVLAGKTKGYRAGVNTLYEVLDAEQALYATKRDFAKAGYEYLLSSLSLKQQIGSLEESDLVSINNFVDRQGEM
jgi:outer membrane protein